MPFCSNCGVEIKEDARFCAQCGTPVVKPQAAETSAPSTSAPAAEETQPASSTQPEATTNTQNAQATQSAPQSQTQPPQQVYAKGCVAAAWGDITNSKGWFGKVALMALINFIPILNWIIPGYCMRWSRQLVFGRVEAMPKNIFCNRAFVNGVFAFVIGLVVAIALWVCTLILGFIPIIGWIAIIALTIFAAMFQYVCYMRAAVADSLGAGFQISKIWETFTRNLGSLFCATILPGLIIGIIISVIVFIILSIGIAIIVGGSIFDVIELISMSSSYGHHGSNPADYLIVSYIIQLILAMIPVAIISGYIAGLGTSLADLLTFRAMGHWVARYASDWADDPAVTITAHTYDVLETPQQTTYAQAEPQTNQAEAAQPASANDARSSADASATAATSDASETPTDGQTGEQPPAQQQ